MEPTNPNQNSEEVRNSHSTVEEKKEPERAQLGELYQFLSGNYYLLLIIGIIAALAGGKAIEPFLPKFLIVFNPASLSIGIPKFLN